MINGIIRQVQSRRQNHRQPEGFTLIEVMIGIIVASVLVLGLTALWATISENFLSVSLRQKAVLVLNGEMERVSAVYQFETPSTTVVATTNAGNLIYANTYLTGGIIDQNGDFRLGEVFYRDNGNGIGADDRNLVWLDQSKRIVGSISWIASDLDSGLSTPAVAGAAQCQTITCQFVTLYIEFPFRFELGTQALTPMSPLQVLNIETIVARRS